MTLASQLHDLQTATSIVALVFQVVGTALIALLSYFVSRAVRRGMMPFWTAGWTCYAAALLAILFAFRAGRFGGILAFAYFFLEYAAIVSIYAACYSTARNRPPSRYTTLLVVPSGIVAGMLAGPALHDFSVPFAIHSGIIGIGWAACFAALWPAMRRSDAGPGLRIVAAGLVLLCLDYVAHAPTVLYYTANHHALSPYYYTITAMLDGMLEFVLGFGTLVVIVDFVRGELERTNAFLKVEHERAEAALHSDPLTEVLTRYSFDVTFRGAAAIGIRAGSVVVADLDGLKPLNDSLGHGAGDRALRAVAEGLRAIVRSNDLVYRWGGDEFVVVMASAPEDLASRRMEGLNGAVNRSAREANAGLPELRVSYGVAAFTSEASIEAAIASADAALYAAKSMKTT